MRTLGVWAPEFWPQLYYSTASLCPGNCLSPPISPSGTWVVPHDLWFLLAGAVPDSKQPPRGLDGGPSMRSCLAFAKGGGEDIPLLKSDLKFKLTQTLAPLGYPGHEGVLRGLTQIGAEFLVDGRLASLVAVSTGQWSGRGCRGEHGSGAGLQDVLASYPEPHQLGDGRLILPQGPHIGILLEGGHVVVDVQHVDPDPAGGLLTTPVPGDDCQGEALDELIVQSGDQQDESCVLVQREPVSGRTGERKGPWGEAAHR